VQPKAKILVVDDDPNLRKTLADILRIKGYEATVAANGAEAIAAAQGEMFSLALIDLMLPDMPGIEVMARIKAGAPLTEAIILTGHASMDSAIDATKQGAYSYLLKPYQMEELLRHIQQGVERQQAQEEIIRLASFPRLLPSPVIELDPAGAVSYLNPIAEQQFPELRAMGQAHPLLQGAADSIALLRQGRHSGEAIQETKVGAVNYELHISYVREVDLIRIYALDITQRKQAEEEIYLLATTDSLTGIANRREFSAILAREITRAKRYGTPLSLVMYDIDFFKRVNDSFGHDVGDAVLQALTKLVKANIRANDVMARWGGEEFMLLMPQTDIRAAGNAAEKLRLAIAKHRFEQADKLTVSFGVATLEPQDDPNALLKRLDDALYRAKALGRNRVETLTAEVACK
jgi:two-component system cell cycle response regulator